MATQQTLANDTRAISIFVGYLFICSSLTAFIARDLVGQYRKQRTKSSSTAFTRPTLIFAACAAVSLAVTWYYMLSFFSLSYCAWAFHHGFQLPARPHSFNELSQWIQELRLGSWLKDVKLFREAWETAMETPGRLCWSQPIFFIATLWAFFVGENGMSGFT